MKINFETCLVGKKVILVPYRKEHVETYHEWMSNPDLLELTASEPLSLDEEYEMLKTWREDEEKCTFIVLERSKCEGLPDEVFRLEKELEYGELGSPSDGNTDLDNQFLVPSISSVTGEDSSDGTSPTSMSQKVFDDEIFVERNLHAMVGDVNLFRSYIDGDEMDHTSAHSSSSQRQRKQAELNVMIAEPSARRKGIGTEACQLMMLYGIQFLGIESYFVKISENNLPSKTMFERALGFKQCNYVECFREYELDFLCTKQNIMESFHRWRTSPLLDDRQRHPIYFRSSIRPSL